MNKKKNKQKIKVGVFLKEDLLKNSPGKAGRHMDVVRMGTGAHRSKKDYSRKQKHKKNTRDLL